MAALVAGAALCFATACGGQVGGYGGGSGGGGGSTNGAGDFGATKDDQIAASVPAKYKNKGTLVVATDPTYPPNESVGPDGKTIVGMDPDLAKALGVTMGLQVRMQRATFDSILAGIASGKYDIGMSSFTDTKDREKVVDFVTYYNAGTSFYVKSGVPKVTSLDQVCGKTVAVEKGTTQQIDVQKQTRKCQQSGQPAPKLQTYTDQNGANQAIQSGRAQVGMADSPVAENIVQKSGGQFEISGEPYGVAPYGIAVPKDSGLDEPLQQAMQKLIDSGVYKKILDKYGIGQGAIQTSTLNGAKS